MNKSEYLLRLTKRLNIYEVEDEFTLISNYDELINEILYDNDQDFNAVINQLGYPEILADELAAEFGFEKKQVSQANAQVVNKERKRYNTVWNVFRAIAWLIQATLIIGIMGLVILNIIVGFNSKLIVRSDIKDYSFTMGCLLNEKECHDYDYTYNVPGKVTVAVCSENSDNCFGIIDTNLQGQAANYYQNHVEFCQNESCKINDTSYQSQMIFKLQPLIVIGIISISTLMLLNYILIIRSLNKVVASNNEYNRRRNYE